MLFRDADEIRMPSNELRALRQDGGFEVVTLGRGFKGGCVELSPGGRFMVR